MKTTIKVALAALTIAAFAFEGCKKGEGDPFLSLKSRKARVAGEWNTTAGSGSYGSGSSTTTWTYDGTTYTETDASGTNSNGAVMKFTFEKDGTFSTETTVTSTGYSRTTTESGTWNFTGGVGEAKNKDHIVMRTLSTSTSETIGSATSTSSATFTGDDAPTTIYYIYQLKGKEMIIQWDGTTTSGSSTSTDKGEYTLSQ